MGEYEELDRDLVRASSVRGDVAAPAGSYESMQALALSARALQRFHEDDLFELKAAGCLAEALDATIVPRPCALTEEPEGRRRQGRVIADENRARRSILAWAAHAIAREAGRAAPTEQEIAELRTTYHRLLREAASKGALFELEPGAFRAVAP